MHEAIGHSGTSVTPNEPQHLCYLLADNALSALLAARGRTWVGRVLALVVPPRGAQAAAAAARTCCGTCGARGGGRERQGRRQHSAHRRAHAHSRSATRRPRPKSVTAPYRSYLETSALHAIAAGTYLRAEFLSSERCRLPRPPTTTADCTPFIVLCVRVAGRPSSSRLW